MSAAAESLGMSASTSQASSSVNTLTPPPGPCLLAAGDGACLCALLTLDPQADQGADLAAELDRLVLGEVAEMLHFQLAVGVLVDGERVDDAYRVGLAEPLELGDDLAVEVGVVESQYDQLHRSNCHVLALRLDLCSAPASGGSSAG